MIKPLQRVVGPFSKPIKITPLTKMIPEKETESFYSGKIYNSFVPLIPENLILEKTNEQSFYVPKKQINNVVSSSNIDDWSHVFERFSAMLTGLLKTLSNIRKYTYSKVIITEIEKKEVERRHNILKEKLLDKTDNVEEEDKKNDLTDKEKAQKLIDTLAALGFTAAGMMAQGLPPPGAELDAATLAQVRASGADLIAAAHLATLEASSPQHVSDVMQVILNRARGQSGGIPAVITAREQFTPYSAAIYGGSPGDPAASAKYGNLKVTKAEIFQLASQPNGLQALTDRFNAGNPSVAAQVLTDIKSGGPLSTSSKQFVGGAQYFTGYPKAGARRRPDGGNYFRDSYSSGAIFLPELFDMHRIYYDTELKPNLLSNFIVDKPTILDVSRIGEPLIIIPLERPIGRNILKIIFERPFSILENKFRSMNRSNRLKTSDETLTRPLTSKSRIVSNSSISSEQLSSTNLSSASKLSTIHNSSTTSASIVNNSSSSSSSSTSTINNGEDFLDSDSIFNEMNDSIFMQNVIVPDLQRGNKTVIDTINTSTKDMLDNTSVSTILFKQDIFVT